MSIVYHWCTSTCTFSTFIRDHTVRLQAHGAHQSLEFSIYVAVLFAISYVLSRLPNNPQLLLALCRDRLSALSPHGLVERIRAQRHSHRQKKALLRQMQLSERRARSLQHARERDLSSASPEVIELETLSRARESRVVAERCAARTVLFH